MTGSQQMTAQGLGVSILWNPGLSGGYDLVMTVRRSRGDSHFSFRDLGYQFRQHILYYILSYFYLDVLPKNHVSNSVSVSRTFCACNQPASSLLRTHILLGPGTLEPEWITASEAPVATPCLWR